MCSRLDLLQQVPGQPTFELSALAADRTEVGGREAVIMLEPVAERAVHADVREPDERQRKAEGAVLGQSMAPRAAGSG
jgi:hypothetical protein